MQTNCFLRTKMAPGCIGEGLRVLGVDLILRDEQRKYTFFCLFRFRKLYCGVWSWSDTWFHHANHARGNPAAATEFRVPTRRTRVL